MKTKDFVLITLTEKNKLIAITEKSTKEVALYSKSAIKLLTKLLEESKKILQKIEDKEEKEKQKKHIKGIEKDIKAIQQNLLKKDKKAK